MKTLLIVESPAKAKTIEKLLGPNYVVKSSFGHIRELAKENFGVDIDNNFKPNYKIVTERSKQIKDLIDTSKKVDRVLLAADEDREGEAIAWHVSVVLKINVSEKNRICFHEITKKALENAVANPRYIDMNMVNSQQARRILDRIVGFSLSPLLWKHIAPKLSAGRVQSVCLKLTTDKEEDIEKFSDKKYYKTKGTFDKDLEGFLNKNFENKEECIEFLEKCKSAKFKIKSIEKKKVEKKPPPSYITSSIQQDAGTRFTMSSKMIMNTLQKLYENGHITYHRTDNINLGVQFIDQIENYVNDKYGANYFKKRIYKSKVKCAQEAHEAIRPTNLNKIDLGEGADLNEKKIYDLIWKRTVASQMANALYDSYNIDIEISTSEYLFNCKIQKLVFDGYKKVYQEFVSKKDKEDSETKNIEDDKILSKINVNDELKYKKIISNEKYSQPPARYSEPTLIKKMESLGIGRPSTWSSIINILIDRNYVTVSNIDGKKKDVIHYILEKDVISDKKESMAIGSEKKKIIPTEIGKKSCKFLSGNFDELMDYKFTSNLEEKLDEIVSNKIIWNILLKDFYDKFKPLVDKLNVEIKDEGKKVEDNKRYLGIDKNDNKVYAYVGKFGPVLQFISNRDPDAKHVFQKLEDFDVNDVTLEDLEKIKTYPIKLGEYNDKDVLLKKGKYGLYLEYNKVNYKILEEFGDDIGIDEAIRCIDKKKSDYLYDFDDYKVKNGPYGPYIIYKNKFYKIMKTYDIDNLTKKICKDIVIEQSEYKKNNIKKEGNKSQYRSK